MAKSQKSYWWNCSSDERLLTLAFSPFMPHPEESFHSFVYRYCKLNNVRKLPRILTTKGQWAKFIHLNDEARPYFLSFTDKQIIEVMRKSGFALKEDGLFDDPTSYSADLDSFINGASSRGAKRYRRSVKYCMDCIRESIAEFGFGFFKAEWYYGSVDHCAVHKKSLEYLPRTSEKDGLFALSQILKGISPINGLNRSNFPYREPYYFDTSDRDGKTHCSLCLMSALKKWFTSNEHNFPEHVAHAAKYSGPESIRRLTKSQVDRVYTLKNLVGALLESDYKPFHDFWAKNTKQHTVYCGVIEKTGLREHIYIRRVADCQRCVRYDWIRCPANLNIVYWKNTGLEMECMDAHYNIRYALYERGDCRFDETREKISSLSLDEKLELLASRNM